MSLLSRLWACCRPQKADQAFQDLYGAQLKHHEEDPLFAAIIRDDLAEVRRLCAEDPQRLRTHDPMGAYPIHIAFLRGAPPFDMGKALVVADPEWATCQYAAGKKKDLPCAGENILHIAIIRQEVELVKWLLQRAPGLLKGEATGSFFAPGRDTYFGGYPLLFAVASNQMEMVEAILGLQLRRPDPELERYSSIFLQDAHGNGALHLCVVHDLKEMYDFCVEEAEEEQATARTAQRSAGDVPFGIRPNKEHLTPLALAAAMGNAAMFRHLLLADKREGWEYGPIKSYMVPLAGLEHSTGGRAKTAVKCLCAGRAPLTKCLRVNSAGEVDDRVYKGRLEIVDLPQVQQLLDKKWKYFGCRVFWRKCISFLTMQVLWTISVVIPHHYRLDKDNFGQYPVENIAIVALEAVVGLLVLQRLWKEGTEIVRERAAYFDNMRGAAAFDNLCTVLFIIFYVAGFLFRRAGERWPATYHPHLRPQWPLYALDDFCHAFAAFVGWMNLFFFLLGMRSTGPFIIMITEMVSVDLRRFMAVYIAVLLSYGMSMYLVLDSYTAPGLARFGRRFWELTLLGTTGELPASLDQWQHSLNGWWANLLLISYIVFVMILLLNLLIAMMNNRYTMIDEVFKFIRSPPPPLSFQNLPPPPPTAHLMTAASGGIRLRACDLRSARAAQGRVPERPMIGTPGIDSGLSNGRWMRMGGGPKTLILPNP